MSNDLVLRETTASHLHSTIQGRWTKPRGRPHAWQVESYLKVMGVAGLASAVRQAGRVPSEGGRGDALLQTAYLIRYLWWRN